MAKRTQIDEVKLLRRALADLYMVHTGRGNRQRLTALLHLHCKKPEIYDMADVEKGVLDSAEFALKETHGKGY